MVYDLRHIIVLFGLSLPLVPPQIVNVLHQGCHILWMFYIWWWAVGLIVRYLLMLLFCPLTDIFIIIAILIHWLFFFRFYSYSCSPDAVLVILGRLGRHASGIFPHSCDYAVHLCGSGIGYGVVPVPHSCGFFSFFLGCVRLNIGWNFIKHGRLIIFSWTNIFPSVIGIVIFWFHISPFVICPLIAVFVRNILPFIGVFMCISFSGIIVVISHSCDGGR